VKAVPGELPNGQPDGLDRSNRAAEAEDLEYFQARLAEEEGVNPHHSLGVTFQSPGPVGPLMSQTPLPVVTDAVLVSVHSPSVVPSALLLPSALNGTEFTR